MTDEKAFEIEGGEQKTGDASSWPSQTSPPPLAICPPSQLVNPHHTRVWMGTLTDGVEVLAALAEMAKTHTIQTATFELLGGLTEVTLTAYDFVAQKRLESLLFQRPLEIVAGHGTISLLDDQPHVHLHLALAFRDEAAPHGISLIGGHCGRALAFAVEFTLTAYDGNPMRRAPHVGTGLMLWRTGDGGRKTEGE